MKRLRPCSQSHSANSARCHNSPRWIPSLKRQCSCNGRVDVQQSGTALPTFSTAKLSEAMAAIPLSVIHWSRRLSCPSRTAQAYFREASGCLFMLRIIRSSPAQRHRTLPFSTCTPSASRIRHFPKIFYRSAESRIRRYPNVSKTGFKH